MKKFFTAAIILAAMPIMFTSCSNDNDLPDVNYSIEISGGVVDENSGTIYVVQGDTLNVESLSVTNVETGKVAVLAGAEYYWDYNFLGGSPFPPYGFKIYVSDETTVGDHDLTIRTSVLAEGKEPAIGIINYPVMVVSSSEDLPTTATYTTPVKTMSLKTN